MPTESGAWGCSPHALRRNPNLVRYRTKFATINTIKPRYVVRYTSRNKISPINGILDRNGISSMMKKFLKEMIESPRIIRAANTEKAGANIFKAWPEIIWSALRFMDANACSKEKINPVAIEIMIAIMICNWGGIIPSVKRINIKLVKAPMIMMPSRPMFTTPLREEYILPMATINNGIEKFNI